MSDQQLQLIGERKSVTVEFKVNDEGHFEAIFSTFNVIDHDGDVTLPGAFDDGAEVIVSAYGHGSWMGALPVGKGVIKQTDKNARIVGEFFLDTTSGKEHHAVAKRLGSKQEWSYGFDVKGTGDVEDLPEELQGADRVLTLELHAGQIQGFFDIPVDNLFSSAEFERDIRETFNGDDLTFVSPDAGGIIRARGIAKRLDADLAIVDKRRERAGESEVMNIIGDVEGRRCIIVDDIVDSAGTLCNAAEALKKAGACKVSAHITHGVFTGEAVARIEDSVLDLVTVTDSIQPTERVLACESIRVIPIAPLMAEAMRRISEESSVSSLFD